MLCSDLNLCSVSGSVMSVASHWMVLASQLDKGNISV